MILNRKYYLDLMDQFDHIRSFTKNIKHNSTRLTLKIILKHYREEKTLHVNFQDLNDSVYDLGKYLFIELANDIFLNYYDLPNLTKGCRLRDKRKYSDGKKHDYVIKNVTHNSYSIEHMKNKALLNVGYDDLVKKFMPIEQGIRQSTLQNYSQFFTEINGDIKLEFTPTNFEKKIVFIAKKTLWDYLPNKNKIPCTYLPNPTDGCDCSPTKGIPAIQDSMIYVTPKYQVCYENILLKGERIKAIIVFDTEVSKIEQMLQDKIRFGFNLIVLSNSFTPVKNLAIPCWNWFKEELEILNAL